MGGREWDPDAETELKLDLDTSPPKASAPPLYDVGAKRGHAAVPSQPIFVCPRCNFAQPKGDTCASCGVIFAKMRPGSGSSLPPRLELMRSEPQSAPPVQVEQPKQIAARGFWDSLGVALTVPFRGIGALWIPLLMTVLIASVGVGGRIGWILRFAFLGLLGTYFAKSAWAGLAGEACAPALQKPRSIRNDLVLPGLGLNVLAICLWGPPAYLALSVLLPTISFFDGEDPDERAVRELAADTAPWNPDEVFRAVDGSFVSFHAGDEPQLVQRSDGRWARVHPHSEDTGYLELLPFGFEPGQHLTDAATADEAPDEDGDASLASLLSAAEIPTERVLLIVLLVALAFYYWPMALAIGTLGGDVLLMFNPIMVLSRAFRGGLEYLTIVWLGVMLPAVLLFIAMRLPLIAMLGVLLGALGYLAGVQGYLMGRLIAGKRALMPEVGTSP